MCQVGCLERMDLGMVGKQEIAVSETIATNRRCRHVQSRIGVLGQRVHFDIDTRLNGPPGLGSYLRLFYSTGKQLAANNDAIAPGRSDADPQACGAFIGFDAYIPYTVGRDGTYYIGVSNWQTTTYNPFTGDSTGLPNAVVF